jgi:hypothetical protein
MVPRGVIQLMKKKRQCMVVPSSQSPYRPLHLQDNRPTVALQKEIKYVPKIIQEEVPTVSEKKMKKEKEEKKDDKVLEKEEKKAKKKEKKEKKEKRLEDRLYLLEQRS